MKNALPILLLASLTGCFGNSTERVASASSVPVPPALTQSLASPCPSLNQLSDQTIGELVTEDADAAVQYAGCQTKHAEVTGLYSHWRQVILDFVADLRKKEEKQ